MIRDAITALIGGAVVFVLLCGLAFAEGQIPCWKVKAVLAYHGGDRNAARATARAHGYSATQIAEAERRCR